VKAVNDGQLQFTRVQPSTEAVVAGKPSGTQTLRTPSTGPTNARQQDQKTAPLVVDSRDAVPGVSALATAALPPRLAARKGVAAGPTEMELREMFFRAVQAAAERSPQVQRAQAEYEAAEADIDEAKGQRWPQVDLGTQSKAARFGSGSENDSGGSGGVNLNVTTPIYDWGRISQTIDSRKHLSKAAQSGIEAELESSAYDVTTTMVELGKQRIIIDISQQFVDRMDELVKMLAGIVAVDKGRTSELTQAKARLLQAQAARDTAQTRARDAEINLRKLVGERPLMIPRTQEWNMRLANLDTLLAMTEDHPTIHQAKAQTESAELQAKVVRSSSLPQLNWVVSKTTAEDALGREQPWQTSVAVTWGAFRGGSSRASERAALQRAEASRQETEQQRLDLEYRIRTADHDARTLLERAELYRDLTVESDRIRLAFYEQWYHLGKRTLLDVLTAENDHYGNKVSEITNRFDGYQAILRQYAGAGALSGWLQGSR
jgi:adhesin transport system outer membrane protein